jgi:hypothetical protein
LPGGSRTLWTATKGFRVIYITSPSPGLILTQVEAHARSKTQFAVRGLTFGTMPRIS